MDDFPCEEGRTAPSAYMADQSIRELAKWPEEGAFELYGKRLTFGQLKTGIYYGHDGYYAMSLNTALGRFLITSYVDFIANESKELKDKNGLFLVMIADIMRRLRPEDRALYYSVKEMWELYWYSRECPEVFAEKMQVVKKVFSDKDLLELKVWREWREEQRAKGEMKVFFDYDPDEGCDEFFREYFGEYDEEE